ncbi:hypothetical protein FQR65_LT07958 [Abscondita terminalis]|nr:hypothetical protein FQR65_LT07958 [Abscondita terminalis]
MITGDSDVQKEIELMIALIDQEAKEKVEEIEIKMEEEFKAKKNQIAEQEISVIREYYKKKEQNVKMHESIKFSNITNQVRLKILEVQNEKVQSLLSDLTNRLSEVTLDPEKYCEVLEKLLIQGILRLLENNVTIRVKKEDLELTWNILPNVIKQCEKYLGKVQITIDSKYLPSDITGGVKIWSRQGKIKLNNTLESRMTLISSQLLPEIRNTLFGPNPNRYFND